MKTLTKAKAFWTTSLLSLLLFTATCWSAALQDTTPYWIESIGYFILTYLCIDVFTQKVADLNPWMIGLAAIIGQLIIQIPMRIMDFPGTVGSLMIVVSCIIAILLAVICQKDKRPYSFILAYVVLALFNSAVADIWSNYTSQFLR
ncbi:MAG: hypothetical protein K2K78_05555 [Muribaculaceae bacterium]|nr:hypothetical protein [Muribaculaceae bacterium]